MPVRLSYINAQNEEIILDDDENSFAHELVGRTGMEMPQIETEVVTYGDGSQDIVLSRMKSRTVTCYFWVDLDNKVEFERKFREVKSQILQVGSRMGDWGKLKVRRTDGTYLFLNCIYKSGFDAIVRDGNVRLKFSLTFEATDPLFYNVYESKYIFQADEGTGYLYMNDDLFMLPITDTENDNQIANPDSVYMTNAGADMTESIDLPDESQRVYPTITMTGSGKNIAFTNLTTGQSIEFNSSVVVDGSNYVLVETKPLHRKAVLVNALTGAETSIMSKLSANSSIDWYLEKGENVIHFTNSEATPESKLTFTYTERFLTAE